MQVLTFYGGMPASGVEKDITNRMERWTGQAAGTSRQESRSITGASIVRNYYRQDIDPNGALTQVNSLASAAIPNLPPGTLPPVILPFDPTSSTPVCIVALDSKTETESILYDVGRYEVRNMIMAIHGAVAPVVYGGKLRAIMAYLDRTKMQARGLSPVDVMKALDSYNLFLPTGDAKFGGTDYAIDSNSMYDLVQRMGDIPLAHRARQRDVPQGRGQAEGRQFHPDQRRPRERAAAGLHPRLSASRAPARWPWSTASKKALPDMKARLSRPDIDLKVVMDQSVYVRHSIESLVEEGVLGAVLCSLVILVFLGEWRMTIIAVLTVPIAVLATIACLYYTGNTINVMTLAGLSLAIGPLIDTAIICLENTHRHLGLGRHGCPRRPSFGASEVAMPELAASCCTLLVLAPLAMMPGMGQFLFLPMASAVTFAMVAACLLSWSFVPTRCAGWLKAAQGPRGSAIGAAIMSTARSTSWPAPQTRAGPALPTAGNRCIAAAIAGYVRGLGPRLENAAGRHRWAVLLLAATIVLLGIPLRREFFPEVDAGAFEIYVRAPSGTRIETDGEEGGRGRAIRPRAGGRRPAVAHQRDRRDGRLVGGLHAQRRADGRGPQGPVEGRAAAFGPGIRA